MSETRVYEAWETDGVKATHTRVQADGTGVTFGFSAHYDGKDYKYTGSPDYDIIALKRVDANAFSGTHPGHIPDFVVSGANKTPPERGF